LGAGLIEGTATGSANLPVLTASGTVTLKRIASGSADLQALTASGNAVVNAYSISRVVDVTATFDPRIALTAVFDPGSTMDATFDPTTDLDGKGDNL
jgi:hypothetical protein